jgi:putative ABC transport system permease protein
MKTLWQDVRYGVRMLGRSPGLAAAAVLCLGLGIGAMTTIFSVVNGALLRPFPYEKPEELALLWEEKSTEPQYADYKMISASNFLDYKGLARAFEDLAVVSARSLPMRYGDRLDEVRALTMNSNLLNLLGVAPKLGRGFLPEEDEKGRQQVAILTEDCWRTWFQKDPNVIGKSVLLRSWFGEEQSYAIVGVMPPEFMQPVYPTPKADILIPLEFSRNDQERGGIRYKAIGRLRAGMTMREARAELDLISRRLREQYPKENEGFRLMAGALRADYCGDGDRVLYLLLGASGLLLAIACANVADLLLIRGLQRGREITIRATLGAGRLHLLRQLVMEGLLVALLGLGAGVLISVWALAVLRPWVLTYVHVVGGIGLDLRVLAFAAVIALATGAAFGLLPALQAWRMDLSTALKGDAAQATTSVRTRHIHRLLVVGQMALALILLVGAGLAVRTFANLLRINPGFSPHQVLAMWVEPPRYDGKQAVAFQHEVVTRAAQLPGVISAAISSEALPLWFPGGYFLFDLESRPAPSPDGYTVRASYVSADYFRTLGVALLLGRDFRETEAGRSVVIINRTMAQQFWPSGQGPPTQNFAFGSPNPLGERLKAKGRDRSYEVIGVVEDERYDSGQLTGKLEIAPRAYFYQYQGGRFNLMLRTAVSPLSLGPAVRALIRGLDDRVLVRWIRPMEDDVHGTFKPQQLTMLLVGVFAVFACTLTVVGLYGVMTHSVRSRYREIAIRLATGARPADVVGMILKQGAVIVGVGMGVGLAGMFALARVAASYIYGVAPMDGLTIGGAVMLLGVASAAACLLPARRAAQVNPMVALRYE